MIDTLPLGEIGWQHAPLDPTCGHRKDGIEYGPHTQGARSSTAFGGGDQIFDPLPFLVCQVAWIYFFVHIPILHNPRRLFRQALSVVDVVTLVGLEKRTPAHPEQQAPLADVIDNRRFFCDAQGIGQWQHLHGEADPYTFGPSRDGAGTDQWGREDGALRPEMGLTQPESVEARVFSHLH